MHKIITWVDLQGRYRVTSPAYWDGQRPAGETEAQCLERVWAKLVAAGVHGIPIDHPHFYIEPSDQNERRAECCGNYFRYAGKPDAKGERDATGGAWEMDTDGRPKVNMAKARGVQMDKIRTARNIELAAKDVSFMRAVEAGDTSAQATIGAEKQTLRDIPQTFDLTTDNDTPAELRIKWPSELPARE
jgi:uncharacterized Zn-finger protein